MFDFSTATRTYRLTSGTVGSLEGGSAPKVTDFEAAAFWEEHCIECGAPACYGTCEKFVSGPTGRCRRFDCGIMPVVGQPSMAAVKFKEWGKIELRFTGRMVSSRLAAAFGKFDRFALWVSWICRMVKWYGQFRYRLLCHFSRRNVVPQTWKIAFYVDAAVDLTASVFQDDKGDLFQERSWVGAGWHRYCFKIPNVEGATYFRISAVNGTSCPVVFSELSVLGGGDVGTSAEFVKCVAWDLDNTVWDGILANDGEEGIKPRQRVVEAIKELDRRGILNTVCSKNDFEPAWHALESFGISEYFVFPQINWLPKSGNIKHIAKDINIGLDTFAFVDDSRHERGEVQDNLPVVRVFGDCDIDSMLAMHCFNPPVSAESGKRRLSYLAEMKRRRSEDVYEGDHDAFLKSCEIVLELTTLQDNAVKKRCWELVNRTNQLTLAARRYTEASFDELLNAHGIRPYAIKCHDKYGDYGIVGFVAISENGDDIEFSEFVMSCRVAKKKCEFAIVDYFAREGKKTGKRAVIAKVVPTGRNKALVDSFDEMPGIVKDIAEDGIRFKIDLIERCDVSIPVKVVLSH